MEIRTNSKEVKKGDVFIALKGVSHDGHEFIKEAIENGASKIIAERGFYGVPYEIVSDTRVYLKDYLEKYYYPQINDIKLIGITGTNGKTTTAFLLYEAFKQLGYKAAYIGTIGFYIDEKEKELSNTTPDLLDLYHLLRICKEKGCKYVVMEVSSHSLSYGRVDSLLFDYAIFTNLTQDHLDYHKTMENYATAKEKLFTKLKTDGVAIINNDDPYKERFLKNENHNITYGFSENSDYQIGNIEVSALSSIFNLSHLNDKKTYQTQLLGKYNLYNLTSALVVLTEENLCFDSKNVEKLTPPIGRMEKIRYNENTVIIDYAHTPDAVEKVLKCASTFARGKVYTIVGCGGNRDKSKRPIMAKVATTYSDYVIFTSDNPRDEDPISILDDMERGVCMHNYEVIVDREKAISSGIQLLKKEDVLLVLGKGHETYQIVKGEKKHFDDKEIVMKYI